MTTPPRNRGNSSGGGTHDGQILIVGGYGHVGRAVAETLTSSFPESVVVAGRDAHKAQACSRDFRGKVAWRTLDLTRSASWPAALDGVGTVVVCAEQPDARFAAACLGRGCNYVDVSASHVLLSQIEALDPLARRSGATGVLSVGLAPGLTNLLVKHAKKSLDRLDKVDITVMLGLGEAHGAAAVAWTLKNLVGEFETVVNGRTRSVRSLSDPRRVTLAGETRGRTAYRFNFSDQHTVRRTLGVREAATRLCFDSRLSTWLLAASARTGVLNLARLPLAEQALRATSARLRWGTDTFVVQVDAEGELRGEACSLTCAVSGHREGEATGRITALVVRHLLKASVTPSVSHIEHFLDLASLSRVCKNGVTALCSFPGSLVNFYSVDRSFQLLLAA